jgi:hypothetical protein
VRKRFWLALAILLIAVSQAASVYGAEPSKLFTYEHPLAYIGRDGNLWIADLELGHHRRLTSDGTPRAAAEEKGLDQVSNLLSFYSTPQWSLDGTNLSIGLSPVAPERDQFIYVFPSGELPISVPGIPPGMWSPDGKKLVYSQLTVGCLPLGPHFPSQTERHSIPIEEITLNDKEVHVIAAVDCQYTTFFEGSGFAGRYYARLLAKERYRDFIEWLGPNFDLAGTAVGYLFITAEYHNGSMQLISPEGKTLWTAFLYNIGLSPNKKLGCAFFKSESSDKDFPGIIDLTTGKQMPLGFSLPEDEVFLPTDDKTTLFYSDVERNESAQAYSKVSLWKLSLIDGKKTKLFSRIGYGIGVMVLTPDSSGMVFSFVTSTAFAGTRDIPAIAEGYAYTELLHLDFKSGKVRLLALGGQPTLSSKPFTIVQTK